MHSADEYTRKTKISRSVWGVVCPESGDELELIGSFFSLDSLGEGRAEVIVGTTIQVGAKNSDSAGFADPGAKHAWGNVR